MRRTTWCLQFGPGLRMGHTEVRDGARLMRKESADARNVTKSLEGIAVGRSYLFPGPERFDQVKASQRRVVGGLAAQRLDPTRPLESVLD